MSRFEQLEEISADICDAAGTMNIPILVLAQLNRAAEKGDQTLDTLKGCGSLEEDPENVWILERDRGSTNAVLHVRKARQGRLCQLALDFDVDRCIFRPSISRPTVYR